MTLRLEQVEHFHQRGCIDPSDSLGNVIIVIIYIYMFNRNCKMSVSSFCAVLV